MEVVRTLMCLEVVPDELLVTVLRRGLGDMETECCEE